MKTLDDLRTLASRVQEASQVLEALRLERETAIRDVRRTTHHTVAEIADAAGVSQATVKIVVRGLR